MTPKLPSGSAVGEGAPARHGGSEEGPGRVGGIQRREGQQAWGQWGGQRREARAACLGLSEGDTDKTFGWKTSSYKVIFTRKLCFVDLLLCAERILITTF